MLERLIRLGVYLVILFLPLYFWRFQIGWLSLNFLEAAIYFVFALWLFLKRKIPLGFRGERDYFYPALLIFFGATLGVLFSLNPVVSAGIWRAWIFAPLCFGIVLIDSIKNDSQIRNVILSFFFSGAGVAAAALAYWINGNLTYDGRLSAFYLSANHLAMYLSPVLITSFYLLNQITKRIYLIFLFIGQLLLFLIIYLTNSYGAWLGIATALCFLLISAFKKRGRVFYITLISLFLLFLFLLGQIPSQKFQQIIGFSYPSFKSRLVIWQSAWTIIKDHPFLGVGPGMFQKYYLDYQSRFAPYLEWAVPQPHNIFLAFWLQTGLLGLVGFLWLIFIFFRKKINSSGSWILAAAMIYTLVHGLIDTTYWKNDLSIIFWLIIALNCRASRQSD